MSALNISLFGNVRIIHNHVCPIEAKLTPNLQALLAYLLLYKDRSHSRDILASIFWGDSNGERARGSLSTALWRLRQALEPRGIPKGTYLLTDGKGEISFNLRSNHWVDVLVFEENVAHILSRPSHRLKQIDTRKLESTLQLYSGDLLEGFYHDWVLRERERLQALYIKTLTLMMHYYRQERNYDKALHFGKQILSLEPLREEIHRYVMRILVESGQQALAIKQYKECYQILKEELGILPIEETQSLYATIINSGRKERSIAEYRVEKSTEIQASIKIEQTLHGLYQALHYFDMSRENLIRAIQIIENLPKKHPQKTFKA